MDYERMWKDLDLKIESKRREHLGLLTRVDTDAEKVCQRARADMLAWVLAEMLTMSSSK